MRWADEGKGRIFFFSFDFAFGDYIICMYKYNWSMCCDRGRRKGEGDRLGYTIEVLMEGRVVGGW